MVQTSDYFYKADSELKTLEFDAQAVFLDASLYEAFTIDGLEEEKVADFFFGHQTVDAHCTKCDRQTVFRFKKQNPGYNEPNRTLGFNQTIALEAECTRSGSGTNGLCGEILVIVLRKNYKTIVKIGQFPSAADLEFNSLDTDLRKQLSKNQARELNMAIGLNAHGVGVGSFVYLRRIFEDFIYTAEAEAKKESTWDPELFTKARMSEKVKLLQEYLPRRLVENSGLYSILSKGVHELTESECLAHFQILHYSILAVLKERADEKEFKLAKTVVQAAAAGQNNLDESD